MSTAQGMTDLLQADAMIEQQTYALLNEIQNALLNKEDEINETIREAKNDPRKLSDLSWILDTNKHGFNNMWQSLTDLAKNIQLAQQDHLPRHLVENQRANLLKYEKFVTTVVTIYKKENKQVLMNISRKMIQGIKDSAKQEVKNKDEVSAI